MSEGIGGYSEEVVGVEPKPLLQESPPSKYEIALEHLQSFAEMDVSGIATAVELAERVSSTAQDLEAVATEKGRVRQREDLQGLEFALRVEAEQSRVWLQAQGDRVIISKQDDKHRKPRNNGFYVEMPMKPFNVSDMSLHNTVSVHALSTREGDMKLYMPLHSPNDAETQRGFAALLQEGIKDVISTS